MVGLHVASTCVQAPTTFGWWWELPVYLINSIWLEAKKKICKTRKEKINKTKIFPARTPLEIKHVPVSENVKERRRKNVSDSKNNAMAEYWL